MSVRREFARDHERLRAFGVDFAAVHGICLMGCDWGIADAGILICVLDESLREIMSVYERIGVDCVAFHGICLMCCDRGLADAGSLV